MEKIIEEINDLRVLHDVDRWAAHSGDLFDIDVIEITATGISSEVIAAVFQCSVEVVEETIRVDKEYVSRRQKLVSLLESESEYDYSGAPFLGRYPVRLG